MYQTNFSTDSMKLFVFFGLPGTGKTYAGELARDYFGYHLFEGDTDLTQDLRKAFKNSSEVNDEMRDKFFLRLITSVKKLTNNYERLIICQTFIKEKYRIQFLREFPHTEFILIETDSAVREKRLFSRKTMLLEQSYARRMAKIFEKPQVTHYTVKNNEEGTGQLVLQLEKILR